MTSTSQRSFRGTVAFLFASGVVFAPVRAWAANTCAQSSDCPKGFSCQVTAIEPPCAAIECAPGATCPQPSCPAPEMLSQCAALPCTGDGDCASGMVCFAQTTDTCAGTTVTAPACPPGQKCAEPTPAPQPCTATTTRSCVPKYLLPCRAASDCGDGFKCIPDQVGSCSGGGSAPSEDGGPVPPPPPPVCTTMTLSTSHCEANTVTCSSDAECPSGWTCEASSQGISSTTCAAPSPSLDGGPTSTDCTPTPPPAPPPKQCAPPYSNLGSSGAFGEATSGRDLSASAPAPGAPTSPSAADSKSSADGGGCTLAAGRTAGGGAIPLLGLVGLVGVAIRRRRAAS